MVIFIDLPTVGSLIKICTRMTATSTTSYDLSPISSHMASLIAAVWSLIRMGKIPGESSNSRSLPKWTHLLHCYSKPVNLFSIMQVEQEKEALFENRTQLLVVQLRPNVSKNTAINTVPLGSRINQSKI